MKITEVKKKNGTTVYRASVYLGIDQVTGKRVKTSITGRTKTEVKNKFRQTQFDFKAGGSTVFETVAFQPIKNWLNSSLKVINSLSVHKLC